MNNQNSNSFAAAMLPYQKVYDLAPLFEDFLDLCLCVLSPGALAGFPINRGCFENIVLKYSDPVLPFDFVGAFARLMKEIRCYHYPNSSFNDVLGDFYEEHILGYDSENPFSSWDLDDHMARRKTMQTIREADQLPRQKIKVLDELCGSGRRLLSRRWNSNIEGFYGIDISPACAKMTILNLFLNRMPSAEVMCITAKESDPCRFHFGYAFSEETKGIVKISRQEESAVWQLAEANEAVMVF